MTDGGTDQGLVLLVLEAAEEVRGYLKLQLHCRLLLPRPPHLCYQCGIRHQNTLYIGQCVFTGDTKIVHLDLFDNKRQRGIGQSNILHSTLYFELHVTHKNLYFLVAVFAKRRIRLNPLYISQFILNTDLDGLLSEHCELLLQIVPQEKEVHHCTHTHTHTHHTHTHTAWLFDRC